MGFVTSHFFSLPTAGSDYSSLTAERTFNSGDQIMCVDIIIIDDIVLEPFLESFTVSLTNSIFLGQGTVTIVDNEEGMSPARTLCW